MYDDDTILLLSTICICRVLKFLCTEFKKIYDIVILQEIYNVQKIRLYCCITYNTKRVTLNNHLIIAHAVYISIAMVQLAMLWLYVLCRFKYPCKTIAEGAVKNMAIICFTYITPAYVEAILFKKKKHFNVRFVKTATKSLPNSQFSQKNCFLGNIVDERRGI